LFSVVLCKDHFELIESPPDGMTVDEAAALRFYTMKTPFYSALNAALRLRDREKSKPFFPYLQLLLLAMHKLPKTTGSVALFRGTRNLSSKVIKEYQKKSDEKMCGLVRAVQQMWPHYRIQCFVVNLEIGRNL
jgi:NAD:arginine ADP-ribosyltransferase